MSVLRLAHSSVDHNITVTSTSEENGQTPSKDIIENFSFALTDRERQDLRWYLENFLERDLKQRAERGKQIEEKIKDIGKRLFEAVFPPGSDARDLWAQLRDRIQDTRVEIEAEPSEAAKIPWELIRDPKTDRALALSASAFVRIHPRAAQRRDLPEKPSGSVRILLVICRSSDREDLPFRSVANPLVRKLYENANNTFQLDVLRPPKFAQLRTKLWEAKREGKPYHIVHFDGHGRYDDTILQGYLEFEKSEKVNGSMLGTLLFDMDVPVLLLNACRSARAALPKDRPAAELDPHARVRAFGSVAEQAMEAGVAGVVGMGYKVYVDTAAQFVAELYELLAQAITLGEAATEARKRLEARSGGVRPMGIASDPYPLQDWSVPVVYEAVPIALFSKSETRPNQGLLPLKPIRYLINKFFKPSDAADNSTSRRETFTANLRPYQDTGFVDRDETLLAIERAFYDRNIVLLPGETRSGNTATAAEFGRWYALTGGVNRPVLFTACQPDLKVKGVLEQIGQAFAEDLKALKVDWRKLKEDRKWDKVRELFSQVGILWIWDGEIPDLAKFLQEVQGTKAKFLLTTGGQQLEWLGNLRFGLARPPMPTNRRESPDFYVERPPIESICYQTIAEPGSLLRIKAPKQMGKTLLIGRIKEHAAKQGYRAASLDFQSVEQATFINLDKLLRWFCINVSGNLGLPSQVNEFWDENYTNNYNCTNYFEEYLLPKADRGLVLCLDKIDLVFPHREIASDFLGLLRSWHERAKTHEIWQKLRLVVAYASEVYIKLNLQQSPFNVGELIELPEFTSKQMLDLADNYWLDLTETQIEQLQQIVGGHPYLVQQALAHLKNHQNETLEQLLENADTAEGIYSKHLREQWQEIQKYPELKAALKKVVASQQGVRLNPDLTYKLQSMGLTKVNGNDSSPRCELYRLYFSENLEDS